MKRTAPLRQRTPLRRKAPIRRGRRRTRYARRDRDLEHMHLVRSLPCAVRESPPDPARTTRCRGEVQADHMGERGLSQKAPDASCVPMCRQHHRERTDHLGAFWGLTREQVRAWRAAVFSLTQERVAQILRFWSRGAAAGVLTGDFGDGFEVRIMRMGAA